MNQLASRTLKDLTVVVTRNDISILRRISVRVTAEQFTALEQRARELRLTVADLVRQLVGV